MFILNANKEDVLSEFPYIQDWIDNIKDNFFNNEIDDSEIEFTYSYGFFIPKVENKEELYDSMYEKISKMLFDDRLEFELSKVRVNLTIKVGKHFLLTNRLEKGSLPLTIKKIVTELTKVKMTLETNYNDNDDIKKSIPDIDNSIVDVEFINDIEEYYTDDSDDSDDSDLNLDDLLDKINQSGMESLSDKEKEFLNKKSQE